MRRVGLQPEALRAYPEVVCWLRNGAIQPTTKAEDSSP